MEKELRKKFAVVTMSLLVLVFGIFFTASHFYYKYWYDINTYKFVKWITDSGVLLNETNNPTSMGPIKNNEEFESITAVIVSLNNGERSEEYIINYNDTPISDSIIDTILSQKADEWRTDSHIYAVKKLPEQKYLIVMVDDDYDNGNPFRYISAVSLVVTGIALLMFIIFILSKFVTRPAQMAMIREKQFISDASHELKTPLGAISINAQALSVTDRDNKHIRNIIAESERMNRLIEKLLTLSELEENTDTPIIKFSLSSCVEEMALTYESVAYEKGVEYDYCISEDIYMNGNEDEIRQLIAILIDNAIKNTNQSGSIKINLSEKSEHIILQVRNSGCGISEEDLPRIFERFYKSDSSRSDNSFGLGLAIAKAITQKHNGTINAVAEDDGFTCFTAEFPHKK